MLFLYRNFFTYFNCLWILLTIFALTPYSFSMALPQEDTTPYERIGPLPVYNCALSYFGQDENIQRLIGRLENSAHHEKKLVLAALKERFQVNNWPRGGNDFVDIATALRRHGDAGDRMLVSSTLQTALELEEERFHPHHRIEFAWILRYNYFSNEAQKNFADNFLNSRKDTFDSICKNLSFQHYVSPSERRNIDAVLIYGDPSHKGMITTYLIKKLRLVDEPANLVDGPANNHASEKNVLLFTLRNIFHDRRTPPPTLIDIATAYKNHGGGDEKEVVCQRFESALQPNPNSPLAENFDPEDKILGAKLLIDLSTHHLQRMRAVDFLRVNTDLYNAASAEICGIKVSFEKKMVIADAIYEYGTSLQKPKLLRSMFVLANGLTLSLKELRVVTSFLRRVAPSYEQGSQSPLITKNITRAWLSFPHHRIYTNEPEEVENYINNIIPIFHSGADEEKQAAATALLNCCSIAPGWRPIYANLALSSLFSSPITRYREQAAEMCWSLSENRNETIENVFKYLCDALKHGSLLRKQEAFRQLFKFDERVGGFSVHPVRMLRSIFNPQSDKAKESVALLLFSEFRNISDIRIPLNYHLDVLIYIYQNGGQTHKTDALKVLNEILAEGHLCPTNLQKIKDVIANQIHLEAARTLLSMAELG